MSHAFGAGRSVEIRNFRLAIGRILQDSPSLKTDLTKIFDREYHNARQLFLDASSLPADGVSANPAFSLEEALDENWLP